MDSTGSQQWGKKKVKKSSRYKNAQCVRERSDTTRGKKEIFAGRMETVARRTLQLKSICDAEVVFVMKRRDGKGRIKTWVLNTISDSSDLGWQQPMVDSFVDEVMTKTYPTPMILTDVGDLDDGSESGDSRSEESLPPVSGRNVQSPAPSFESYEEAKSFVQRGKMSIRVPSGFRNFSVILSPLSARDSSKKCI